jgi:hypothetical protein
MALRRCGVACHGALVALPSTLTSTSRRGGSWLSLGPASQLSSAASTTPPITTTGGGAAAAAAGSLGLAPYSLQAAAQWVASRSDLASLKTFFRENGYGTVPDLVSPEELGRYKAACTALVKGTVDASRHRHDLGSNEKQVGCACCALARVWDAGVCGCMCVWLHVCVAA